MSNPPADGPGPDLAGAVHLDNPLLEQARGFLANFAANGGNALIIIGAAGNALAVSAQAPGGQIQALGMLTKAIQILAGQEQQASPNVSPNIAIARQK